MFIKIKRKQRWCCIPVMPAVGRWWQGVRNLRPAGPHESWPQTKNKTQASERVFIMNVFKRRLASRIRLRGRNFQGQPKLYSNPKDSLSYVVTHSPSQKNYYGQQK